MESWEGLNYNTTIPSDWINLMNLSTVEWRVGYFPEALAAIPGPFNDSIVVGEGVIVIPNASKTKVQSQTVVGAASAFVVLWALIWLYVNRYEFLPFAKPTHQRAGIEAPPDRTARPPGPPDLENGGAEMGVIRNGAVHEDFVQAEAFERQLRDLYYQSDKSEAEAKEKDFENEELTSSDIEAATALLRKMYRIDFLLYASQNTRENVRGRPNQLMCMSDAILTKTKMDLSNWHHILDTSPLSSASKEEKDEINAIRDVLSQIKDPRYPDKRPQVLNSRHQNGHHQ